MYPDSVSLEGVLNLLDVVWPGIATQFRDARDLGASLADVSTPFVRSADGRMMAHVGVIELPCIIGSCSHRVAGLHALVTHPDYRGQGHARSVLEEAIRHACGLSETLLLFADEPELYRRFGFRLVDQSAFRIAVPPIPHRAPPGFRRPPDPELRRILIRLLPDREPVSHRFGVSEPGWLFTINVMLAFGSLEKLHYADDVDTLAVFDLQGSTLILHDLVARRLPDLASLLARLPSQAREVELRFSPDRLAPHAEPVPRPKDALMARGPLEIEGTPFMIPSMAHF